MRVYNIDPAVDPRWNKYIEKHPYGCIFHHSTWKNVLDQTFTHLKPYYMIVEDSCGTIKGIVPIFSVNSWITGNRLVSLPFTLYCDPLVDSQEAFKQIIDHILGNRIKLHSTYIEIRTRYANDLFKNTYFRKFSGHKNHTLSLDSDLSTIKKSFHRSCIRQRIIRAENSPISIYEAHSSYDLKHFFKLYCNTRKKVGLPPQPYQFFKNMWDELYPQNLMNILIAKYRDQPVSSLLYLKYKQRVHAEFMGNDYHYFNYSPNILLFWQAIQRAKSEGYQFFDFGGSASDNINLITFKRRWGTVEEDISYYYFPNIKGLSVDRSEKRSYRLLTTISSKLPDHLFTFSGELLYRHLGG